MYGGPFESIQAVLVPLLMAGCAVAVSMRFRGSGAGKLATFGFGVLAVVRALYTWNYFSDWELFLEAPMSLHVLLRFASLIGWGCLLAAFLSMPVLGAGSSSRVAGPPPLPDDPYRPRPPRE